MLKFDPNKPLRKGDVILVEATLRFDFDLAKERRAEMPESGTIHVKVGYSQTSIPFEEVHGIARRRFDVGEEVLIEAGKGKVLACSGEWLWIDLGDGTPASVHADSVSRIDESQPDLLAGGSP